MWKVESGDKKLPRAPSSSNPANKSRCNPVPPPDGEDASAELLPSSNHPHCLEPSIYIRWLPKRVEMATVGFELGTCGPRKFK